MEVETVLLCSAFPPTRIMALSHLRLSTYISNAWNPANRSSAEVAEYRLINHFVDQKVLHCCIRDIPIVHQNIKDSSVPVVTQSIHTLSFRAKPLQHLNQLRELNLFLGFSCLIISDYHHIHKAKAGQQSYSPVIYNRN